eukprot:7378304-Prymnesium_polylepis.1
MHQYSVSKVQSERRSDKPPPNAVARDAQADQTPRPSAMQAAPLSASPLGAQANETTRPQLGWPIDEVVEALSAMFPNVTKEHLAIVVLQNGNVDAAVSTLLDDPHSSNYKPYNKHPAYSEKLIVDYKLGGLIVTLYKLTISSEAHHYKHKCARISSAPWCE